MGEDIQQSCVRMGATTPHLVLARRHSTTTNHSAQPHHPWGVFLICWSSQPDDDILCWVPLWSRQCFGERDGICQLVRSQGLMQVEVSQARALQNLSPMWNTLLLLWMTMSFPSNGHSWSKQTPLMTLPLWQSSSLHWLCRIPEVKMQTQMAQLGLSFLKAFKKKNQQQKNSNKKHFKWLVSFKSDESLLLNWKGRGSSLAWKVYPRSFLQRRNAQSICGFCMFLEADFPVHFFDYAHVIWWLSDFSNCCCSPAWPVAIN